jgi:hypothetical protein
MKYLPARECVMGALLLVQNSRPLYIGEKESLLPPNSNPEKYEREITINMHPLISEHAFSILNSL